MCAGGTGQGGVRGWSVGPSCSLFDYLLMNEAALNQFPVNMHDSEEKGNANGFVCLSVCLPDKVVLTHVTESKTLQAATKLFTLRLPADK